MNKLKFLSFLCFIFLVLPDSFGQKKEQIQQEDAEILERGVYEGKPVNKFKNHVRFRQKETLLYCDSAFQYIGKNAIEAFGNVRIVQGDSLNLTGDRLTYNGDTKKAVMTSNVYLRDKKMTLTTQYLEYDLKTKLAYYINGGTINDGETTLTSEFGYYSTAGKTFRFKKNVKVVNNIKQYVLTSDTLHYNTITKIATFKGPTKIESKDGIIIAEEGTYNTLTAVTNLGGKGGKAKVQTGSYTLTGDHIYYDEKKKVGVVKKNVRLVSEKDRIVIEGNAGYYWGNKGITKIFGNALMKSIVNEDTLYLSADTLISIDNNDPAQKRLLAFNHTKIYKSDLQGRCDSLAYNFSDSTISFYRDPVLWNGENQILADSISIELANKQIYRMNLNLNSFIISRDTLKNFNQMKGKKMVAWFRQGDMYRINVDGNGETVYFALDGDSILTGMNKVACSNMTINLENNKVRSISFIKNPDGRFIPPHELKEPEKRLKGFRWRSKERPQKQDLTGKKSKIG